VQELWGRYGSGMRVLITGATGKVGSRLVKQLAIRGYDVRALVRDPGRAAGLRAQRVEIMRGDLLDSNSLESAVKRVDAVVHCATAYFDEATSEQAMEVNELGSERLAGFARDAGVRRLVFTSTGLVYGDMGGRVAQEEDVCAPPPGYFASKLATERLLLGVDGFDVRILRLPFVYGDGDGHIAEVAPIAHQADVVQAVALVMNAGRPSHRIYNVVDDEAPTLGALFAAVGAAPPDGSDPAAAGASDVLLDGRRLRQDLGFKPLFPRLRDAVDAGAL
jgi:UDP-glucose 4-epimerase